MVAYVLKKVCRLTSSENMYDGFGRQKNCNYYVINCIISLSRSYELKI
jgi:hypothetical protein